MTATPPPVNLRTYITVSSFLFIFCFPSLMMHQPAFPISNTLINLLFTHALWERERDRDRYKFRLFVWVLERNPDGFQFVLDVLRDVLCDIPGFDAVVHMVVEEAREHRDILPESDLKGFGSIQRRVQYPEPVCLDPGGYVLYGKGNHRNLGIWHCCLLCVLEDWFVSASLSLCHFLYVILVKSL